MSVSLRQKIILSITGVGLLSLGLFITGLFYSPAKSIADRSGCAAQGATPISGNGQSIGTFACPTYTPSPTPSPTPKPTPPPVRTAPVTFVPQPQVPNPLPPAPSTPVCGVGAVACTATSNGCVEDGPASSASGCCPDVLYSNQLPPAISATLGVASGGVWCDAKPVIYLYPKKTILVNVSLETIGKITTSIPTYPSGGWRNILAQPNGEFTYQEQNYHELFYENTTPKLRTPIAGYVVHKKDITKTIQTLVGRMGLTNTESQELIAYWIPRLDSVTHSYLFISVIDPATKDRIDHVTISPKPDTFIGFNLYFKPVDKPFVPELLRLPETPPQRVGFTAVEWGGVLDAN